MAPKSKQEDGYTSLQESLKQAIQEEFRDEGEEMPEDLKEALSPFDEVGGGVRAKVAKAGLVKVGQDQNSLWSPVRAISTTQPLDLENIQDEELVEQDTAFISRILYVASLLRLLRLMRRTPENRIDEIAQGKFAMAYVRHAETTRLEALLLGRSRVDDAAEERIKNLESRLDDLAHKRARLYAERGIKPKDPGGPARGEA